MLSQLFVQFCYYRSNFATPTECQLVNVIQCIYMQKTTVGGGGGGVMVFGIGGVKIFGIWDLGGKIIWDLGKIFGIWDLRLINFNILSEIHI